MKKSFFNCLTAFFCLITFFSGCVSATLWYQDMDFNNKNLSGKILNLRYFGDAEIVRQGGDLMKKGFLDSNSEEYGYFSITFEDKHSNFNVLNFYDDWGDILNINKWDSDSFGVLSIIILPIIFIIYFTPLVVATPLVILGAPTDYADFKISAKLDIFDSEGNPVKSYKESGSFKQVAGIYYGHDPIKKATESFLKLFDKMFNAADADSAEINRALGFSGPITERNKTRAMEKISAYLDNF